MDFTEIVALKVTADKSAITALETQVNELKNTSIKFNVDISGIERLTNAQARAITSANNLKIAQEKTKQTTEQRLSTESKLAVQMEKTVTAEEQARTANAKLSTEIQKTVTQQERQNTTIAQTALQAEKTSTAIANLAVQQEKVAATATLGVSGPYNATPMQQRIEDMVGLGAASKSAADSAAAFQSAWASGGATPTFISQLGNQIGTLNANFTSGSTSVKEYITSLNGMSSASVKATGQTSQLGASFQTFTASVKNADGSLSTYKYSINAATGQVYQLNTGLKEAGETAEKTGDTIMSAWKKMLLWSAAGTLIYGPIRALKEALQTLQAVDDELVEVRKVTDFNTTQMSALEKQAYKTASAYGVSANEYLSSVAGFARAGYKEQSDALAELATKTEIVGDVDQETAEQFLLSVDAAYKYKGSISDLSKVLDGANELDNKYATSIQKITEGLGKVAPVAAQANMGVDELSAAIGTITAVTMRSGTEAATALRALILNILKDTKTEITDGETATADSIKTVTGLLNKYAASAMEAARATGKVVDPMKAIGGMAQAMKDGLLTEKELMDMASDLGGKLRTTQLVALIQNWDMYKSMLTDFGNAAGSADKEVENAMDSWTRKTEILKNTWAEFVNNFVNTDAIKKGIDDITKLIDALDSDAGHAVITVTALTTAFLLLEKGVKALTAGTAIAGFFSNLTFAMSAAAGGAATLGEAMSFVLGPIGIAIAAAGAIYAAYKFIDSYSDSLKNTNKDIEETNSQISDIQEKLDKLKADGASDNVIDIYQKKLDKLNDTLEQETQHGFDLEFDETVSITEPGANAFGGNGYGKTKNKVQDLIDTLSDLKKQQDELSRGDDKSVEKNEKLQKKIDDTDSSLQDYYADMVTAKDNGVQFSDSQADLYLQLVKLYGSAEDVATATKDMAAQHVSAEAAALENSNAIVNLISDLSAESTQAGLTKKEIYNLTAQSIVFNNTSLDVEQKLSALRQLASMAGYTAATVASVMSTDALANWVDMEMNSGSTQDEAIASYFKHVTSRYFSDIKPDTTSTNSTGSAGSTGSGSGKSSSKSTKDPKLEALKNTVELRKSELALLQQQNAPVSEQIAKTKQIQAALHNEAEYLRKTKGDQSDINGLSKEYLEYSKDIQDIVKKEKEDKVSLLKSELSLIKARGESTDAQIAKMQQIQAALHEEANYLRSINADQTDINALSQEYWEINSNINSLLLDRADKVVDKLDKEEDAALKPLNEQLDVLEAQNDARTKSNELEEKKLSIQDKQLAVEKARQALINAENERTVRYYNAASGQWEWMADHDTVKSAKDSLTDAQKNLVDAQDALADYYENQAYEEAKQTIQKQQEQIKSAYDAFRDAWDDAKSAVQDGSMALSDAYKSMADATADIFDDYSVNLSGALQGLADAIYVAKTTVTSAAETTNSRRSSGGSSSSNALDEALFRGETVNGDGLSLSKDYLDSLHSGGSDNDDDDGGSSGGTTSGSSSGGPSDGFGGYGDPNDYISDWGDSGPPSYDSGGIANGKGLLNKATDRPESVLDPELTAKLLTPNSNEVFRQNLERIGAMFSPSSPITSVERPISNNSSVDSHNKSWNFNGVPMPSGSENMTMKQFAQAFQTLSLYPS